MTLTPREDFKTSPHAKMWDEVVASDQFKAAAKAAMLHVGSTCHNLDELRGAQDFLRVLMSLTETPEPKNHKPLSPNLLRT